MVLDTPHIKMVYFTSITAFLAIQPTRVGGETKRYRKWLQEWPQWGPCVTLANHSEPQIHPLDTYCFVSLYAPSYADLTGPFLSPDHNLELQPPRPHRELRRATRRHVTITSTGWRFTQTLPHKEPHQQSLTSSSTHSLNSKGNQNETGLQKLLPKIASLN